MMLDKES